MSMTEEQRRARYGGPLVTPRAARLLAAAVSVVFIAVVVVVGLRFADQPVKGSLVTYEHAAPDRIAVTFTVSMRPHTEASCTIQAMNAGAAQVGFVDVPIPPQEQRISRHRVEIATQGEAVSAEILTCTRR